MLLNVYFKCMNTFLYKEWFSFLHGELYSCNAWRRGKYFSTSHNEPKDWKFSLNRQAIKWHEGTIKDMHIGFHTFNCNINPLIQLFMFCMKGEENLWGNLILLSWSQIWWWINKMISALTVWDFIFIMMSTFNPSDSVYNSNC